MERSFWSALKLASFASKKLFRRRLIPAHSKILERHSSVKSNPAPEKPYLPNKRQLFFLKEKIIEEKRKSHEVDWAAVQEAVLKEKGSLNKQSILSKILSACAELDDLDSGKSFLSYLKSQNVHMSLGMYLMYFRLCYNCKTQLTEKDRQEVLSMYEHIVSKYGSFLVGLGAEEVIPGVSLTDRWEDGLELLEKAKESNKPSSLAYAALIESATSNAKVDLALKLIDERLYEHEHGVFPVRPLNHFVSYCAQHEKVEHFESLLYLMNKHAFTPGREFAETLIRLCSSKQLPFTCVQTDVLHNGFCKNCRQPFSEIKITKEQHIALRSAIYKDSLIDSHVFAKTNPAELNKFSQFLRKTPPYHVVIDGLNVANMMAKRARDSDKKAYMLATVVHHFVEKNLKVLMLGRNHMCGWKSKHMDYVQSHSSVFYVDNLSSDDHFTLYAALYGDLGTCFVTRDFMRSEKFCLGTRELRKTFKMWQQAHQILPVPYKLTMEIVYPTKYQLFPHKSEQGTWHIPYSSGNVNYSHDYNVLATDFTKSKLSWLCLLPRNKT